MSNPVYFQIEVPNTGDHELDTLGLLHKVMLNRQVADPVVQHRIAAYFYARWGESDG